MKRQMIVVGVLLGIMIGLAIPISAQSIKIGVIQLLERPDFTLLRESFLDELQKAGYTVEVTTFNADSATYPDTYPQRAAEEAVRMEAAGGSIDLLHCDLSWRGASQCEHSGRGRHDVFSGSAETGDGQRRWQHVLHRECHRGRCSDIRLKILWRLPAMCCRMPLKWRICIIRIRLLVVRWLKLRRKHILLVLR